MTDKQAYKKFIQTITIMENKGDKPLKNCVLPFNPQEFYEMCHIAAEAIKNDARRDKRTKSKETARG